MLRVQLSQANESTVAARTSRGPQHPSASDQRMSRLQRHVGNQGLLQMLGSNLEAMPTIPLPVANMHQQAQCACGASGSPCESCKQEHEPDILHGTAAVTRRPVAAEVPPIVHEVLKSPGQSLESATLAFFEPRFNRDLSDVRVHTNDQAAASARSVNASAYTVGRDIVFASSQYQPYEEPGKRLLAHELAHTIQQSRSDFTASKSAPKLVSHPSDGSEQEAEYISERVMSHRPEFRIPSARSVPPLVQRACPPAPTGIGKAKLDARCSRGTSAAVGGSMLHFCQDSVELADDYLKVLMTNYLKDARSADSIEVHGYASQEGPSTEYNYSLACQRATTVASLLTAADIAAPVKIIAHGPTSAYGVPRMNRSVVLVMKRHEGGTKSLTVVSWINPDGLPDFSEADIALTPPSLRTVVAVAMILKCTANKRPPSSLRGPELDSFRNTKEYRGIQHFSTDFGSRASVLQEAGYTAPSRCDCKDVPPCDYLQGEKSPLTYVIAEPYRFEGLMKFRVSASEEKAAIGAMPRVPVAFGGMSLDMVPRVPWVWSESRGHLSPGSSKLGWFVTGSAFPTHTVYVDGAQVGEIRQQAPSVLLGPNVRTADKPRQTMAEEEAQRSKVIPFQEETVRPGGAASGEN